MHDGITSFKSGQTITIGTGGSGSISDNYTTTYQPCILCGIEKPIMYESLVYHWPPGISWIPTLIFMTGLLVSLVPGILVFIGIVVITTKVGMAFGLDPDTRQNIGLAGVALGLVVGLAITYKIIVKTADIRVPWPAYASIRKWQLSEASELTKGDPRLAPYFSAKAAESKRRLKVF